jgi:anti-sigma regulatory factor (Ser/Thr protein kinase)
MLAAIGQPLDVHEVDRERMRQAIEEVAQFAALHGRQPPVPHGDVVPAPPATQLGR